MVVGFSLVMLANVWGAMIAKEVNARRREDQVGVWSRKDHFRSLRLHREMFPNSSRRKQMWSLVLVGAALFFGGFFTLSAPLSR